MVRMHSSTNTRELRIPTRRRTTPEERSDSQALRHCYVCGSREPHPLASRRMRSCGRARCTSGGTFVGETQLGAVHGCPELLVLQGTFTAQAASTYLVPCPCVRYAGTSICLLTAPIIFSVLLLIIQILINKLFLSGPNYEVCAGTAAICSKRAVCLSDTCHCPVNATMTPIPLCSS